MRLVRFAYTPTETLGRLFVGHWSCFTIERPWVPSSNPGGSNNVSCVPEGDYKLRQHIRPNREHGFALEAPELGVYFTKADRPADKYGIPAGRFLILIHSGNYVRDVEGCIAPGNNLVIDGARRELMVTNSRATMLELMLRARNAHSLRIEQTPGAVDVIAKPGERNEADSVG